jgi:hypothetical protein
MATAGDPAGTPGDESVREAGPQHPSGELVNLDDVRRSEDAAPRVERAAIPRRPPQSDQEKAALREAADERLGTAR